MPGNYNAYPVRSIDPSVWLVRGTILTDSAGAVLNANPPPATLDQYGSLIRLPRGITSAKLTTIADACGGTGIYRLNLETAWFKLLWAVATPYEPEANFGVIVGTVDLTGLTLSTLNTKVLGIAVDGGGASNTTFTTPATIQGIADQINATVAGSAQIVTNTSGAQFLRVKRAAAKDGGTIQLSGNAAAILGVSTALTTALKSHTLRICNYNTRSTALNYQPAQSIDFLSMDYSGGFGVASPILSGGFKYSLGFADMDA